MDLESQNDELVVLSSIYEEYFHEAEGSNKGGELVIHLDLPSSIVLHTTNGSRGCAEQHNVQHLPPIYLHFVYPTDYPSSAPPSYTLTCKWITRPQLTMLCRELDRLWQENKGDVILYLWSLYIKEESAALLSLSDTLSVDDLRPKRGELVRSSVLCSDASIANGSAISTHSCQTEGGSGSQDKDNQRSSRSSENFKICDINVDNCVNTNSSVPSEPLEASAASAFRPSIQHQSSSEYDDRTIQDVGPKTNILMLLREYDQDMRRKVFEKKSFECKVCFCDKIGSQCLEFWPCGHVYCKECMKGYFEVQIKEGNVKFLKCSTEKCSSEANPKQVKELVSSSLYERWDELLLSTTLSALGDMQPCPRKHCQYPVTIDQNQGYCPACSFVFCALCRYGEHGVNPCKVRGSEVRAVLEKYMAGDAKEIKELERRFGKNYLTKLRNDLLTINYLSDFAKRCPKCNASIEKIDGCNKMVCNRCGVSFCWLCTMRLNSADPYSHFSNPKSNCFNKLTEGTFDDDEDDYVVFEDDHDEWFG